MSSKHLGTFKVLVPVVDQIGPGLRAVEVRGTDYEVADGILHIAGAGEVGVFASGMWVYAHGTTTDSKEN